MDLHHLLNLKLKQKPKPLKKIAKHVRKYRLNIEAYILLSYNENEFPYFVFAFVIDSFKACFRVRIPFDTSDL